MLISRRLALALFAIFSVSGFSGLIYESIWTHYLKLFLGHAAYAQTLVLIIFMGGLAAGSWLAGEFSHKWRRLLLAYAIIEGVIGLSALVFHPAFVSLFSFSFDSIIPSLGSVAAVQAYKWSVAAIIVLPQSVLLGMTFPLMASGLLRKSTDETGAQIAVLYFANSIGGAIGVLVSGFALIPAVGLPGTILTAGLLNLAVALSAWAVSKKVETNDDAKPEIKISTLPSEAIKSFDYRLLLAASLITGLASFLYEIGWIRMLSLVLGSSTHAFELMLSAFIFGLAFGGLWIKKRIEHYKDPLPLLALVQMVMAVLAMSTLFGYAKTFDAMSFTISMFATTDAGYAGFNIMSHLITMLVMVPTTFCAGMTLPLITYCALRRGVGEKAIGGIYAANTVGAIIGVIAAVHLAMPFLGTKGTILVGAAFDFALGVVLLAFSAKTSSRRPVLAAAVGLVCLAASLLLVDFDPQRILSAVYRTGHTQNKEVNLFYLRDGKTATVTLGRSADNKVALATNGKTDATVMMDLSKPPAMDEMTQNLAGILPFSLHPQAKTAAVVGIGSGMTAQMMLAHPKLEKLDVIEIEPFMVEAAKLGFAPRNAAVFDDKRSRIHIEDAKTFFSSHRDRYDVIVSEPSNPWVSGVASLFTQEYYQTVARHLNEGGILVQWVQVYEIKLTQVASVLRALGSVFEDYEVYNIDKSDVLIVAKLKGRLGQPSNHMFDSANVKMEMERLGIISAEDIMSRRIGSRKVLEPIVWTTGAPINSDYFPFLDVTAAASRFMHSNAFEFSGLSDSPLPIALMLDPQTPKWTSGEFVERRVYNTSRARARSAHHMIMKGNGNRLPVPFGAQYSALAHYADTCSAKGMPKHWEYAFAEFAFLFSGRLNEAEWDGVAERLVPQRCRPFLNERQRHWLDVAKAISASRGTDMVTHGEALLASEEPFADPTHFHYAFGAIALGHLANGKPEAAAAVWEKHGASLKRYGSPGYLRWLKALTSYSLERKRGAQQETVPFEAQAPRS